MLWHGLATACLCLGLLAGVGCRSVGPGTVTRDRLHYTTAMTNFWKEQLLLNIVKSRYGDAPAFLEVVSVVSGYSLETGVSLGGQRSRRRTCAATPSSAVVCRGNSRIVPPSAMRP